MAAASAEAWAAETLMHRQRVSRWSLIRSRSLAPPRLISPISEKCVGFGASAEKTCLISPAPEKWRGDGAAAYFLSADGRVRRASSCRSEGVKRFSLNVSCEQKVILLQQSSNTDSCGIRLWRHQETPGDVLKRSYRRKPDYSVSCGLFQRLWK